MGHCRDPKNLRQQTPKSFRFNLATVSKRRGGIPRHRRRRALVARGTPSMIAADGDVYPLGDVECLDPLRAATGAAWSSARPPDWRQGGRPPAGYATALTAALTSAEVQGGKRRLSYSDTPTAPVVWSRIPLSTIAADGDDLDRRRLPREAARCFPAGNGSR